MTNKEDQTLNQSILVTVSGMDRPGITSKLTKIICDNEYSIIDMGQSVTHGFLSLSFLINIKAVQSNSDHPVLKDLLFEAKGLNLSLDFKIMDDKENFNKHKNQQKYIINCVAAQSNINSNFIHELSKCLSDLSINIQRITNLIPSNFKYIEISTLSPIDANWDEIKKILLKLSKNHQIDLSVLKDNIYRTNKRLIVFDMDSTLIQTEVINELAKLCGEEIEKSVTQITHQAMEGKIDFDESLKQRVSLLKGFPTEKLDDVCNKLLLTPGTEDFIKTVKKLGFKLAVISGGFTIFTDFLKSKLNLDYAFANELEIKDNKLTGKLSGPIINSERKAMLLEMITQQESISLEQVVAIGDGANDLPMLKKAGLGIAFHAKEVVKDEADQRLSYGPMTSILYFLGIPGTEIRT
jgi:phosphoserine phosphatase